MTIYTAEELSEAIRKKDNVIETEAHAKEHAIKIINIGDFKWKVVMVSLKTNTLPLIGNIRSFFPSALTPNIVEGGILGYSTAIFAIEMIKQFGKVDVLDELRTYKVVETTKYRTVLKKTNQGEQNAK